MEIVNNLYVTDGYGRLSSPFFRNKLNYIQLKVQQTAFYSQCIQIELYKKQHDFETV